MQGKLAARPPGILPVLPMASPPLYVTLDHTTSHKGQFYEKLNK